MRAPELEVLAQAGRDQQAERLYASLQTWRRRMLLGLLLGLRSPEKLAKAIAELDGLIEAGNADASHVSAAIFGSPKRMPIVSKVARLAGWLREHSVEDGAELGDRALVAWLNDELAVGPASAARMALLAYDRPVLPLDRPLLRILVRHDWTELPESDEPDAWMLHYPEASA